MTADWLHNRAWAEAQLKEIEDTLPLLRPAIEEALPYERSAKMRERREAFVEMAEISAGLLAYRWRQRKEPQRAVGQLDVAEKVLENAERVLIEMQPWADADNVNLTVRCMNQQERALASGRIGSGLDEPDEKELADRWDGINRWASLTDAERAHEQETARQRIRDRDQEFRNKWERRRSILRSARSVVRDARAELAGVGPGPRAGIVRSAVKELALIYELSFGRCPTTTAADRGRANAKQTSPFERIARAYCRAAGLGMRRVDLLVALADYRAERAARKADEAAQQAAYAAAQTATPPPPRPRRR